MPAPALKRITPVLVCREVNDHLTEISLAAAEAIRELPCGASPNLYLLLAKIQSTTLQVATEMSYLLRHAND
jgi:hypothetical protein